MAYHYLEDFAIADIAFEATGKDLAELFSSAADATMNVMIEDLDTIKGREGREIELKSGEPDMLLFDLLQEVIYYKDAEQLLLRIKDMTITERAGSYLLRAVGIGERLDPKRHEQRADVKAVTLHHFKVEKTGGLWKALVILDV
jgi:SHS2 domain-containing protein